jgi:hypothetical protein
MSISMRENPYKLQTEEGALIDIYCGETDELKQYIGSKVTLEGKLEIFELEGKLKRN